MAFQVCSDIAIGKFKRVKPNSVKVTKSMFEYVDRAVMKLPITARIKRAGEVITEAVETAKQFGEGDKVVIQLGYNGSLKTEFTGFVSRINFTSPLEVECEGYSYQLRKKTYLKTFVNVQLLDVLKYLISGTDIVLDTKNIPSFKIDKMILKNNTGTEALELIKKISDNTLRIFFTGNVLYAGLQYLKPRADVKYRMGWNVIKDGNLKLRQAKNQEVTVHYIGERNDGKKIKVESMSAGNSGIDGDKKVIKSHSITDQTTLKQMADAKVKWLSFDGYEGKITAFGTPYCEPGDRAILEDNKYQERSGNYLVESIEVTYSMAGFRRIVGIGSKL